VIGPFNVATEGYPDEVVAQSILRTLGFDVGNYYNCKGKSILDAKLHGYNAGARYWPWFVLRDMDHDADCAPDLLAALLPNPGRHMVFRIAVREIEAWLLADRGSFSHFFRVDRNRIPTQPDLLDDPKSTVLEIIQHSRSRAIRDAMLPRKNSGVTEGPGYAIQIAQFASGPWQPRVAAVSSDSLNRCLRRLDSLR
jgi:hypothetical protein